MSKFRMPEYYPNGAPLYWVYEQTNVLKPSVKRFLTRQATQEDITILKEYIMHWLQCPSWHNETKEAITKCKYNLAVATTQGELEILCGRMLEIGIDPF